MKAKEWAARFDAAADLGTEFQAFMAEIKQVALLRGFTPNAVEGAVREQKAKFAAVCGLTPRVTAEMWPMLMKTYGQEYGPSIQAYLESCKPARQEKGGRGKKKGGVKAKTPEKDWRRAPVKVA